MLKEKSLAGLHFWTAPQNHAAASFSGVEFESCGVHDQDKSDKYFTSFH
jgi:hypothetical protein